MSDTVVPRLLTAKELSAALGIQLWRLRQLVQEGKAPPHMKIGKKFHFPSDQVLVWIREQTRQEKMHLETDSDSNAHRSHAL